jgi:hypothetical protein
MLSSAIFFLTIAMLLGIRIYFGFFRKIPDMSPEMRARLLRQYHIY